MDQNRHDCNAAKSDVASMADQLITLMESIDPAFRNAGLEGKKCLTRLNRDMRFAKGAEPFKTDFVIVLNESGKNSNGAFYYLHVEPGNCFAGGGVYNPQPGPLTQFREKIARDFPEWKKVIFNPAFQKKFPSGIHSPGFLTKPPKGFDPDSPAADYLRMKGFYTMEALDDRQLQAKSAGDLMAGYFMAARPLVDYLNSALRPG